MADLTIYTAGQVSVANGATAVTGIGTLWEGKVFAGAKLYDPAQPLVPPQRIAADALDGALTLAVPWPGASMTSDAYVIELAPDAIRTSERVRQYLEMLGQLAALGIQPNAFGEFADRDAFDEEAEGFIFLSLDGDGVSVLGWTLFLKLSNDNGDWSDPQPLTPAGAASLVTFTPAGNIAATTVQAAIEELDGEKQPASSDLSDLVTRWIAASAAGPASLDFNEDTDNGTNRIRVAAPPSLSADADVTWPNVTGQLLVGALGGTDNRALRSDGTGGLTAQNSPVTIGDTGNMSGVGNITSTGIAFNMTTSNAFSPQIQVRNDAADSSAPYINFQKSRSNAAVSVSDGMGTFVGQAADSNGVLQTACYFAFQVTAVAAGSVDGRISFTTVQGGSGVERMLLRSGLNLGAPTGGDKGHGTLNAVAVYDDNTLLTCTALSRLFFEQGKVDLEYWDGLVPDLVIPGHVTPAKFETRPILWPVEADWAEAVLERDGDGNLVRRLERRSGTVEIEAFIAEPIYDEEGNLVDDLKTPLVEEVEVEPEIIVPERVLKRQHRTARIFAAMIESGFDPRDPEQYFERLRTDEALPGMPTKKEWVHNALSTGEVMSQQWLAIEMLAIVTNVMWAKMKDHDARLTALESASRV